MAISTQSLRGKERGKRNREGEREGGSRNIEGGREGAEIGSWEREEGGRSKDA